MRSKQADATAQAGRLRRIEWVMEAAGQHRLVQLAAGGDADALQRLILQYYPALGRAVEGGIAPGLAAYIETDDVLQEAYITAFKKVAGCSFAGPGAFYKWLEVLALNELRTQERAWRRRKRDVARNASARPGARRSYLDLATLIAATDGRPSRALREAEAAAAVQTALARLTDDQRAVLRMRIMEDRPAREVAAHLGKTVANVHTLCHRGLKELRQHLATATRMLLPTQ